MGLRGGASPLTTGSVMRSGLDAVYAPAGAGLMPTGSGHKQSVL